MVLFGGRLGTHLVARAALRLDVLERHLAAHQGAVLAPPERLEKPSPEALAALPEAAVRRHKVFPFGLAGGCLEVALRDPGDRALLHRARARDGPAHRALPDLGAAALRRAREALRHPAPAPLRAARSGGRAAARGAADPSARRGDRGRPALRRSDVSKGLADGEELIDAASFARLYERDRRAAGREPSARRRMARDQRCVARCARAGARARAGSRRGRLACARHRAHAREGRRLVRGAGYGTGSRRRGRGRVPGPARRARRARARQPARRRAGAGRVGARRTPARAVSTPGSRACCGSRRPPRSPSSRSGSPTGW